MRQINRTVIIVVIVFAVLAVVLAALGQPLVAIVALINGIAGAVALLANGGRPATDSAAAHETADAGDVTS